MNQNITQYKIKKGFVTKVMQDFQSESHVLFRDQGQARNLIEYSIAKFLLESTSPSWKSATGKDTKVYRLASLDKPLPDKE